MINRECEKRRVYLRKVWGKGAGGVWKACLLWAVSAVKAGGAGGHAGTAIEHYSLFFERFSLFIETKEGMWAWVW